MEEPQCHLPGAPRGSVEMEAKATVELMAQWTLMSCSNSTKKPQQSPQKLLQGAYFPAYAPRSGDLGLGERDANYT
jgi:hypothetical protein